MMHFRATAVAATPAEDCFVVVLAENADGTGARIEFQRSDVIDEEDVRRGMGTYCVATQEGSVRYGGILAWELTAERLEIRLSPEAAAVLGLDEVLSVGLPECDLVALRAGLERVLEAR